MTTNSAELKRQFEEFAAKEAPGYLAMGYWSNGEYQSQTLQQWFKVFQAGRTAAQGEQAGSAEQVSEEAAFGKWLLEKDANGWTEFEASSPEQQRLMFKGWQARAALSAPERCLSNSAQSERQEPLSITDEHQKTAPERKVMTDEAIYDLVAKYEFSGGSLWNGPRFTHEGILQFARALLNQQGEQTAPDLVSVLREVREALQFANDSPGGGINDTIWMMHRPETLFDFIDAQLEAAAPSTAQKEESK